MLKLILQFYLQMMLLWQLNNSLSLSRSHLFLFLFLVSHSLFPFSLSLFLVSLSFFPSHSFFLVTLRDAWGAKKNQQSSILTTKYAFFNYSIKLYRTYAVLCCVTRNFSYYYPSFCQFFRCLDGFFFHFFFYFHFLFFVSFFFHFFLCFY